ncbi:hypothetical protein PR202_ga29143 [Eleusine coracana subsp. coracana]|uniref:Alcohol dehydrogenase n=1 Tax=Eleusine coracana subsp. coracana TaxID=191504 RepID=A0AAV5DL35_ELECO|nr:hypothetical protein PR202_ga29143 [Eleusine coracana subsp. coracana]
MEQNTPMPIRCKAAGQPLVMEEVEVAPPRAYEVRVKILCTSLCHTDLTFWQMKVACKLNSVVPVFLAQCGDCLSRRSNICSKLPPSFGAGLPRFSLAATGQPVHMFLTISTFAEYTVVDVAHVVKVADGLPLEKACLLSCGASTGVGAAWKVAAVEAGSTVAIFGLGTVGLAVAQGAKMCGAKRIIGVDLNPDKFDIGHQGDDRRRRRLLLRVRRLRAGHG